MTQQGLSHGELAYDFADPVTGELKALFDLAWPNGKLLPPLKSGKK